MRFDDMRESENVEDRRDDGPAFGGGGGGGGFRMGGGKVGLGGLVAVGLISYFTGINPAILLGGLEMISGDSSNQETYTPKTTQKGSVDDQIGRFVAKVLGGTEDTWQAIYPEQTGRPYKPAPLVLFSGATQSGCGFAQSAMGPFYCPTDYKVYLDTAFFKEMQVKLKACPQGKGGCDFSQAYVIAHEIGHHVQNLLGILPQVHQKQRALDKASANALSVRTELQADCFAGVWAHHADQKWQILEQGDVESAMQTASAIGDDMLQKRAQGFAVPDSFTHGTSAQRVRWFMAGLKGGTMNSCNTFSAEQL